MAECGQALEVLECTLGKALECCDYQFVDANGGNDSTLNLVTMICTPKEQPFYVAMTGVVYGGGCILGPIVGGLLVDGSATWRWVNLTH